MHFGPKDFLTPLEFPDFMVVLLCHHLLKGLIRMSLPDQINYLELPSLDPQASKDFFTALFGWRFEDYGPDYIAFFGAGIDGGFYRSNIVATPAQGGSLVVLKSANLAQSLAEVTATGAIIVKPIFSFPGGYRFEFLEPGGNQLAIWAE